MPAVLDHDSPRPPPALPNDLLVLAESQWLFAEAELLRTASILDGLPLEKERENRGKGVNFILQVGIMLKLPQITLATASVFLHRFYVRHSMQDLPQRPGFHYYSMAATSLFLATKVEENCRKMKELVVACVRVAQKDPSKMVDEQDREYWRWRDNILHNEDVLLEALCFDLNLEPPYKILFEMLVFLREENNKRLRNAAWAFINDSCLTVLCLLFTSRTIAASALYAAAKHCDMSFSDDEDGRPWWDAVGVDLKNIRRACNFMAGVYENTPLKGSREAGVYVRTPEDGDDVTAKTRILNDRHNDLAQKGSEIPADYDKNEERNSSKRERSNTGREGVSIGENGDHTFQHRTVNGEINGTQKRQKFDRAIGDINTREANAAPGTKGTASKSPNSNDVSEEGEVES